MTGLECLKKEMLAKGFTRQQTESKTVVGVLDILSCANGRYSDMDRLESEIKLLEERKNNLWETCREYESKADACKKDLEEITQAINKVSDKCYNQTVQYVNAFFEALNACETQEARDALKVAQTFINSVDVDTKYDNTAFIIGLASILSHGKIGAIDELRKINKKIPKVEFECKPYVRYGGRFKEWEVSEEKKRI